VIKAIINAKIILNDTLIEDKILLFDSKIIGIVESVEEPIPMIDAKGNFVSAGFIDLHIHGSGGVDVMDGTLYALETLSLTLPQTGTTSFLATTMTMSPEVIENALLNIQKNKNSVKGATILGVHLEGPFLNRDKNGAQDKKYIQSPNFELIKEYINEIKMITLAPEVEGSERFINYISKNHPHIILSIGHSNASYEETRKSFSWGISHATHLFNAMPSLHHREPSIVGAVFDEDTISCDIIADLVHTHPYTLNLTHKMKPNQLILVTDSMRAGCMKNGLYDLGGREVRVNDTKATLEDGTLAGSVLKMNDAMKNMLNYTSMSFLEVIKSVTQLPATKLANNKGSLEVGKDADIVIFDDQFNIKITIINAEVKYRCSDF